jgi:hypothetical protein
MWFWHIWENGLIELQYTKFNLEKEKNIKKEFFLKQRLSANSAAALDSSIIDS